MICETQDQHYQHSMDSDILLLLTALGGLALILLSFLYFQRKLSKSPPEQDPANPPPVAAPIQQNQPRRNLRNRRRGLRNRSRRDGANNDPADPHRGAENEDGGGAGGEEGEGEADLALEGLTEKQMKKALKKREKKEQREAQEASRQAAEENRERRNQKYEEARALREAEREEREREAQERAREEAKKAQEEYDKWKDMFAVEDEGSTLKKDEDDAVDLLEAFIEHIKGNKVVMMEELAGEFNLRIQETMNRLEALEAMGRMTGVFDDRGKFIYISPEELKAVADFIEKKGRVSISELARESNKLIDLNVAEAEAKVEVTSTS